MAIDIYHVVDTSSKVGNITEVQEYLSATRASMFPGGIEKIINGNDGDLVFYPFEDLSNVNYTIKYTSYGNNFGNLTAKNGFTCDVTGDNHTSSIIDQIALVPDGFGLRFVNGGTVFFGVDTDSNTVVASITKQSDTSTSYASTVCSDFKEENYNSSRISLRKNVQGTLEQVINQSRQPECPKTLLEPIIFGSGGYSTNIFMTPYTQLNVSSGWLKVLMDGEEYLYNGLFALKG